MVARVFGFLVLLVMAVSGCRENSDKPVHEIGIESLTRDYNVARAFAGHTIKVRIDPGWYAVVGREIHVPGTTPYTTPIAVFQLHSASSIPDPKQQVYIVGRCGTPVRDGVRRSMRADYRVTITDCLVAQP